jgi:hypothetical protein
MPCGRKKPLYPTLRDAKRHGSITYGKGHYKVQKVGYKS